MDLVKGAAPGIACTYSLDPVPVRIDVELCNRSKMAQCIHAKHKSSWSSSFASREVLKNGTFHRIRRTVRCGVEADVACMHLPRAGPVFEAVQGVNRVDIAFTHLRQRGVDSKRLYVEHRADVRIALAANWGGKDCMHADDGWRRCPRRPTSHVAPCDTGRNRHEFRERFRVLSEPIHLPFPVQSICERQTAPPRQAAQWTPVP